MGALGSCLLSRAVALHVTERLSARDFYHRPHRPIYEGVAALVERGDSVDLLTLRDELQARGRLEAAGGVGYLVELMEAVPTSANGEYYCETVRDYARRRALFDGALRLREVAGDMTQDVDEMVSLAIDWLESRGDRGASWQSLAEATAKAVGEMERRQEGDRQELMATGIGKLDWKLKGVERGDLVVVAGRPSSGKTAFMAQWISHLVLDCGLRGLIISAEVPAWKLARNIACHRAGIDTQNAREGRLGRQELDRLSDHVEQIREAPLLIDDSTYRLSEIVSACRWQATRHGADVIGVDYAQILDAGGDRLYENVSRIAPRMKRMAATCDAAVLLLSQLTQTDGKTKLRGGDELEHEADIVLLIRYPDSADLAKRNDSRERDVLISKHRDGAQGGVRLGFRGETLTFCTRRQT